MLTDAIRRQFTGPTHNQRNPNPSIVGPPFAAWEPLTVVAPEKDDGILGEAIFFQLSQEFTDACISGGEVIVVTRQCLARFLRIRQIGRQLHIVRIRC